MRHARSSALPAPRRLVVRGVNWLGDAVMTLPAVERIRERFPDSQVTILTHQKLADLWKACASVDSVLTFASGEGPFTVGRRLRSGGIDTALVLPNSPRSALEVWWAGIPQRIGYARPWRNWFLTEGIAPRPGHVPMRKRSSQEIDRLIRTSPGTGPQTPAPGALAATAHHVHDYLFLAAALGANPQPLAPRLELGVAELQSAKARLLAQAGQTAIASTAIFLGMNPSAAYGPAKRWPAENFAAAAHEISARLKDVVWIALGDAADEQLCAQIATRANVPILNFAGKTSLRELMGLLAVCQVLLTNDSGPMHLAAALATTVVVPFGSTSPELTGPGLPGDSRHRLLTCGAACSPCFRRTCPIDLRCLTGIRVDQVVSAVFECLATVRK